MLHNRSLFATAALAALALLAAACSSEEGMTDGGTAPAGGPYPLVMAARGMSAMEPSPTRATADGDWDGVRSVAVETRRTGEADRRVMEYSATAADAGNKQATLAGKDEANTYYWQSASDEITVQAWHPYSEEQPTARSIEVAADQSTKAGYEASDVIAAGPAVMRFSDATHSLNFTHLTAKIAVRLTPGNGMDAGDLEAATVTLTGLEGVRDGSGATATVTTRKQTAGDGGASQTLHLALIRPQTIPAGTAFIRADIGGSTHMAAFKDELTLKANTAYTYDITVNKTEMAVTGSKIGAWDKGDTMAGSIDIRELNLDRLDEPCTVSGTVTLTGRTQHKITLADGADVTLKGIAIDSSYMECRGNATIRIAGGTKNTITIPRPQHDIRFYPPCILPGPKGTTLEITGGDTGELELTGNEHGAAIGTMWQDGTTRGDILISGGTITAAGGLAGIGSGCLGTIGDITITGGNITAIGGASTRFYAPGIGAAWGGTCGNILITGGNVTAESRYEASGIGTSYNHYSGGNVTNSVCGDITINGGTVTATKDSSRSSILHDIGLGYEETECGKVTIDRENARVTATNSAVKDYPDWTNP